MKKYSSYFNKRYFPEPEDTEEEPLSEENLSSEQNEAPAPSIPSPPPAPKPAAKPAVSSFSAGSRNAFSFPTFDDEAEPASDSKAKSEPLLAPASSAPAAYSIPGTDTQTKDPEMETTVISESAIVQGELTVKGNIRMLGQIKGNLTASGNLEIAGKVTGNLTGNDVELKHCELKGDVNASGFTFMDKESIMIGNLIAKEVTLNGKVKGDIEASHKVYVQSDAVVVGNIKAAVIAIDEGAALQGQVIIATKPVDDLGIDGEMNSGDSES